MHPERIVVFLPCHSLDDFPTWLDDDGADDLLAAWTAAWHPRLIATVGSMPDWASAEYPPRDAATVLGIVPDQCDRQVSEMIDAAGMAGSCWVRGVRGRKAIVEAALGELGTAAPAPMPLAEDFHALGLAWLLAELLARRMRSSTALAASDFADAVVAAARAATEGNEPAAREKLRECFGILDATRAQYYPVDFWILDLVLLAESSGGDRLAAELDAAVPLGFVATGRVVESLASSDPVLVERLRHRLHAGDAELIGGRDESLPLDECTLTTIRESLARGREIYERHLGRPATTFGQCTGGWSAFLPDLLVEAGFTAAVWNLFDGTPLPDPGASRIRWLGGGGGCLEGVARPPLDARSAATILSLPESIGTALDRDHTAIILFAHHAGTASQWFHDLRRIGGWSRVLGGFVTPARLIAETLGVGTPVDFAADAYPIALPAERDTSDPDPVGRRVAATRDEAVRLAEREPAVQTALEMLRRQPLSATTVTPSVRPTLWGRLSGQIARDGDDDRLRLDNGAICLRMHPKTGGILSLRRPDDRGNRLSQQLAVRSTLPAPAVGAAWEDALERATYSTMLAETIEPDGKGSLISRGRLLSATAGLLGRYTQRVWLVGREPLARIEWEIDLSETMPNGFSGPVLESHSACRFAWNENDQTEIRRSLHGEPILNERTAFTAPHFLEIVPQPEAGRPVPATAFIGCCGLPWHLRPQPQMIDSILFAGGRSRGSGSLAVGLGVARPREVALALLVDDRSQAPVAGVVG